MDVVQADLFRLPFRADTFDAAYSVGVLHHTPDAKGAFQSIRALVKPGGWFGIFIHAQGNRVLYFMNRTLRAWTSRASYRTTWNLSLGLTMCAERSAAAAAIAAGDKEFVMVSVVTDSKKPAVPCGACRQVLAEFNPRMRIVAATTKGEVEEFDLAELLPKSAQGILESDRDV